MKLQIALDVNKKKALSISREVAEYVDIIELGTPLIKQEGLKIVKQFKKFKLPIVADLKTMDTGDLEAEMAFKAGADIVSVCASADDSTIVGVVKTARKYKKKSFVDLIAVEDVVNRSKEVLRLKPDYIGVHTGIDVQKKGGNIFANLKKVSKIVSGKTKIAVAGGIDVSKARKLLKYNVEIVIVGGAITKSKSPGVVAKEIKEVLNERA